MVDSDGSVSFAELRQLALRLAAGLLRLGVQPGDVVAYQLPNSRLCCAVDLAVVSIGAIVLPFPTGRGDRDVRALLRRSRAVVVIVEDHYQDVDIVGMVTAIARELPGPCRVVVRGSAERGGVALGSLLAGEATSLPVVDPDSVARILISSGTEAEPKLVAYSHNALFGGRGRAVQRLQVPGHPLRVLFLIPLATSWGSLGTFITVAWLGGTIVLRPRFDVDDSLRAIEQDRPTHLFGVPTMLHRIMASPRLAETDLSSLLVVNSGAAPIDAASVARYQDMLAARFVTGYGSADGMNCSNKVTDPLWAQQETVGIPDPLICDIKIVDDEGRELPAGEVGEIIGRGPISPLCYVDSPEQDARYRTPDGWVRSGDRGYLGSDGRLRLAGRTREMIIRGGSNISPVEVEAAIAAHPSVVSVACVPVPDVDLGQRLCACVMQRTGTPGLRLDELTGFLRAAGMAPRKLPEFLLVLPELPLSPAGKLDKNRLAALATRHAEVTQRAAVTR